MPVLCFVFKSIASKSKYLVSISDESKTCIPDQHFTTTDQLLNPLRIMLPRPTSATKHSIHTSGPRTPIPTLHSGVNKIHLKSFNWLIEPTPAINLGWSNIGLNSAFLFLVHNLDLFTRRINLKFGLPSFHIAWCEKPHNPPSLSLGLSHWCKFHVCFHNRIQPDTPVCIKGAVQRHRHFLNYRY